MQQGVYYPELSRINKIIIILAVSTFVLFAFGNFVLGTDIFRIFGLSPVKVLHGHIYQLVTYSVFVQGLIELVFNSLMIWFVGSEIERMYGEKKYLTFLGTLILGTGVLYTIIFGFMSGQTAVYSLSGISIICTGLLVAFAVHFPEQIFSFMMVFPVKAKYFCMILAGMELYNGFATPGASLAWGQIISMIIAFLFVKRPWENKFNGKNGGGKPRRNVQKSHLKIVESGSDQDRPKMYH